MSRAKTAEPIQIPFATLTGVGPRKHVLHGKSRSSMHKGNFEGEVAAHYEV